MADQLEFGSFGPFGSFGSFASKDTKFSIVRKKGESLTEETNERKSLVPHGLINPGNLSFLYATAQALLACSPFVQYFQDLEPTHISEAEFPCLAAFYNLIDEVFYTVERKDFLVTGHPFYPSMFEPVLRLFTPHLYSPGVRFRSEDAASFLSFLMDQMHIESLKLEGRNGEQEQSSESFTSSKLSSIFEVAMCSFHKGTTTNAPSKPSLILHLSIKGDENLRQKLEYVLFNYFDSSSTAFSGYGLNKLRMKKLPQILILHFERVSTFRFDDNRDVEFPLELKTNDNNFPAITKGVKYKLVSTITHCGNESSLTSQGYYTADALYPDGQWLRFDDALVTTILEGHVLKQKKAYILFYIKEVD